MSMSNLPSLSTSSSLQNLNDENGLDMSASSNTSLSISTTSCSSSAYRRSFSTPVNESDGLRNRNVDNHRITFSTNSMNAIENITQHNFHLHYEACLERFSRMKFRRSISFLQNGLICLKKKDTETTYQKRYLFFNKKLRILCLCKSLEKLENNLSTSTSSSSSSPTNNRNYSPECFPSPLHLALSVYKTIPLLDIKEVHKSPQSLMEDKCLSLKFISSSPGIDLSFDSVNSRNLWYESMNTILQNQNHFPDYEEQQENISRDIANTNNNQTKKSKRPMTKKNPNLTDKRNKTWTFRLFRSKGLDGKVGIHPILEYAKATLSTGTKERNDGGSPLTFEEWPIQHSLTNLQSKTLSQLALDIFASILIFIGEVKDVSAPAAVIKYAPEWSTQPVFDPSLDLGLAVSICEAVRPFPSLYMEVYLQLIKQTQANPNFHSFKKAWQMLAIISKYYVPMVKLPTDSGKIDGNPNIDYEVDPVFLTHFIGYCDATRFRPDAIGGLADAIYKELKTRNLAMKENQIITEYNTESGKNSLEAFLLDGESNFFPNDIFGVELNEIFQLEKIVSQKISLETDYMEKDEVKGVPILVQLLVERLRQIDATDEDGIFRRASSEKSKAALKSYLSDGKYTIYRYLKQKINSRQDDMTDSDQSIRGLTHEGLSDELPLFEELSLDPHCVGDILKYWVRELKHPLLPYELYDIAAKKVASLPVERGNDNLDLPDYEKFFIFLKNELHLPERNLATLIYICKYLLEVASKSDINRMTRSNLVEIWRATVFRKVDVDNEELQRNMFELFLDIAENSP